MTWQLEKIEDTFVLRYNPSMITLFFYKEEWEIFVDFFSDLDLNKLVINQPIGSNRNYYSFNLSMLEDGSKIVELYFSEKGLAFVIFYSYFESLINLCRKERENVG